MFVNIKLWKATVTRSKLLNKVRQERTISSRVANKKLRNLCVKLIQKTQNDFFNNLDVNRAKENQRFW